MNVPRHIGPLGSNDANFAPAAFGNGTISNGTHHAQHARDQMIVPDRIVVAGGNGIIAEKPPPPEIALDMHTFAPGRYLPKSLLETPPDKLTLHNRSFPAVEEEDQTRHQYRVQNKTGGPKADTVNEEKQSEGRRVTEKAIQSSDNLPPTATMSVLSPSEELVLLRNHVRKLTTRLQKLEEELQDTNRHVNWIEVLGGLTVLGVVIAAMSSLRRF